METKIPIISQQDMQAQIATAQGTIRKYFDLNKPELMQVAELLDLIGYIVGGEVQVKYSGPVVYNASYSESIRRITRTDCGESGMSGWHKFIQSHIPAVKESPMPEKANKLYAIVGKVNTSWYTYGIVEDLKIAKKMLAEEKNMYPGGEYKLCELVEILPEKAP